MKVVYFSLFLFLVNYYGDFFNSHEFFNKETGFEKSNFDVLEINSINNTNFEKRSNSVFLASSDNFNYCDSSCEGHYQIKSEGFTNTYYLNCRNRECLPDFKYGSTEIPYWINLDSINTIESVEHREILLNDIRSQFDLRNNIEMHDSSGKFVNLYEIGRNLTQKPITHNGKKVVEALRFESENNAGEFSDDDLEIRINYNLNYASTRPGRNSDTPLHEAGHLLGLNDLDGEDFPSGTHKAIMGYSRNTEISKIFDAITYHDIQGVACANNIHKDHLYLRYYYKNGVYRHVCFYCDFVNTLNAPLNESEQFIYASNCSHAYAPLGSLGAKHGLKCI